MHPAVRTLLLLIGCASQSALAASQADDFKPRVHRFVSQSESYEANAYLIESKQGLVLIDGLMLQSDLPGLVGAIKASKKPLAGVFLTHPHADHYGGLAPLFSAVGRAPVYATAATAAEVPRTNQRAIEQGWINVFGTDFVRDVVLPNHIVKDGDALQLAGIRFTVLDLGPMEAGNNAALLWDDAQIAFVGDALVSSHVYYLGEGHSGPALKAMTRLSADLAKTRWVYPGHGGVMDPARLVADNRKQIELLRAEAGRLLETAGAQGADGKLDPAAVSAMIERATQAFSAYSSYGFPLPSMIANFNLPGLIKELKDEKAAAAALSP